VKPSSPEGLLDTLTLILLCRLSPSAPLPAEAFISAITLAELSVGPLVASTDEVRAARQARLQQAEADFEPIPFEPIPFDASAARAFGRVAASLRSPGQKPAARAYDALIAATAIANALPLYTCNPCDLEDIGELVVIEVPHPDRG
jgi:predicted nucleic acid-binding protein